MTNSLPTTPVSLNGDHAQPFQLSSAGRLTVDKRKPTQQQKQSGGTFQGAEIKPLVVTPNKNLS